ncbi:MAG: hypothetical protein [Circoviridae sp.]|nr:MAG: hypothetical protein [Circoviridae sp.]
MLPQDKSSGNSKGTKEEGGATTTVIFHKEKGDKGQKWTVILASTSVTVYFQTNQKHGIIVQQINIPKNICCKKTREIKNYKKLGIFNF